MRNSFPVLFSLFLVSLVALSSCKKDGKVVATFTATMEDCADVHNVKTVLNGNALQWEEGDEIKIHSGNTAVFTATPLSPATKATFTTTDHNFNDAGSYIAYYPAEINGAFNQITLPTTQESDDGSLRGFPMHAYADGSTNLQFHNLCGVLKLNLQKTGVSVTSITLTVNEPINGTYYVNNVMSTESIATLAESPIDGTGSNTTTLVCNQSINMAHDFYIYLPEGTYTGLTLEITTNDGMVCTKVPAMSNVSIVRSKYSTLTLSEDNLEFVEVLPQGALPGLFSVSLTRQVRFSQGNLQYQASTNTWRFAENQYDYVGDANSNISSTYSGWIDLFGWGTSGWNSGAVCYQPWSTSQTNSDYYPGGSYTNGLTGAYAEADWAWHNSISNGGNTAHLWCTLTNNEWMYLFSTRANASSKYGTGNINGVGGLIILPDNWTLPLGCTFNAGFASTDNDWTLNSYTLAQWVMMETAGAVFLPATGCRLGTGVIDVGSFGGYWSSIPYSESGACSVYIRSDYLYASISYFRDRGRALRPVQDNN